MNNILNWWNTCNLKFNDKYTILLLQVKQGNKNAKKVMELIDNNPYNNKQKGIKNGTYIFSKI